MVFEKFGVHVWSLYVFNTLLQSFSTTLTLSLVIIGDKNGEIFGCRWQILCFCRQYDCRQFKVYRAVNLRLKVRVNPFRPYVGVFHNLYNSTWSIWRFWWFSSWLDFWFSKIWYFINLNLGQKLHIFIFLSNFYQFWHISWCFY